MTQEEIDAKVAEFMAESVVVDSTNEAYVYNAMNALRDVAENYYRWGMEDAQEQMMKEAVETTVSSMVHQLIVTDYIIINAEQFGLKKGDKVKVLIIKEK